MKRQLFLYCFLIISMLFSVCNKKKFLDALPNSDIVIPSTLDDFQALLDNETYMSETPVLGELSADNYYLPYLFWSNLKPIEHNAYIWEDDIYKGEGDVGDWVLSYKQVFYTNIVLEGVTKISNKNVEYWNKIKGSALFMRAYAFYNLAQIFIPPYDSIPEKPSLGLPLRLTSDINSESVRSSIQGTYDRIIGDLTESASLLPEKIEANRNRPSRPAAYAMLARVYMSMRVYDSAFLYADRCLKLYDKLIDYNSLLPPTNIPFNPTNDEVLYQSKILSSTDVLKGVVVSNCIVDSLLYNSYSTNDLRASLFYNKPANGNPIPRGSYNGSIFLFSGLATDEVYLIRAECSARLGLATNAVSDLNTLLTKRWLNSTYTPYSPATPDLLAVILKERRKELAFRGLRWTDIRRLNKEGYNIQLKRLLNQEYTLKPNDFRYTLLIPPDVILLSGITQNPR